jgi:hypothetical protein
MPVAYLATLRADGFPRVHPVTPIVTDDALFLFHGADVAEGRDLRERRRFALHTGVPDTMGTGGGF